MYEHICVYMCVYTYIYDSEFPYLRTSGRTAPRRSRSACLWATRALTCLCKYVYMYICIYVCIYIYIYIYTERDI